MLLIFLLVIEQLGEDLLAVEELGLWGRQLEFVCGYVEGLQVDFACQNVVWDAVSIVKVVITDLRGLSYVVGPRLLQTGLERRQPDS